MKNKITNEDKELFQPSFKSREYLNRQTYNIDFLLIVAFFGDALPLIVLSARNARWLNIHEKNIKLMKIVGVIFFSLQIVSTFIIYIFIEKSIETQIKIIILVNKILAFSLFFFYKYIMVDMYKKYLLTKSKIVSIVKDAVIWCITAFIIQNIIYVIGALAIYGCKKILS